MPFPIAAFGAAAAGSGLDKGGELVNGLLMGGFNYALGQKSRSQYAAQVRHLRRREYQDMMFSMRKAGLNPILAGGATPGHAAGMMNQATAPLSGGGGTASAMAAHRQAGVGERGVRIAELKAPNEIATEYMRRFGIASEIEQRGSNIDLTKATTAKTKAETELALQESGRAAIKRLLMERQALKEGASARQLNALSDQIERGLNLSPQGMLREAGQKADAEMQRRDRTGDYHAERGIAKWMSSAYDAIQKNSDALRGTK